jgi:uncharacterized membrane protein YphA (DoxX/SURF4 family)
VNTRVVAELNIHLGLVLAILMFVATATVIHATAKVWEERHLSAVGTRLTFVAGFLFLATCALLQWSLSDIAG